MNAVAPVPIYSPPILYPESDGKPMANNALQYEELTKIKDNLEAMLEHDPGVLVEGDMLWYPLEGHPEITVAPDVFVVFGRPKGYRGSYLQWREAGIAPQVVFEILSPGNTVFEMRRKLRFYERHGVEEYYEYDPQVGEVSGWLRQGDKLEEIEAMQGWVSPRLGIRFEMHDKRLDLFYPDGRKFESFVELDTRAAAAEAAREQERQRAERLLAQLRALGVEPEG